jgi:phenylacetate-CoA ligase
MDRKNYYFKEAEVFSYWARHGFELRKSRTVMFRAGVLFKTENNFIPRKPWRMDYGRNMLYLSSYYASDEYFAKYYDKLRQWKPEYMHILPSAGFLFADYLDRKGLTLRFKMVFSASEMLFPAHKEMMEKVFKCKVLDHYGHGEPGIYAAGQCDYGNYHLEEFNTIVERQPDGSIIETCLNNYSQPFIRYKVGDKISKIGNPGECPCGLPTGFIGSIEGRESSFIYTGDGRRISSIGFDQIFKDNNIIMGQIIQEVKKELIVKLVPNETFTENNHERLLESLKERVGKDTKISVNFVNNIPKAPSGKYNLIVSKI